MTRARFLRIDRCRSCNQTVQRINGAHLRQLREASEVSLRELARRMELSAPYLSDLELNRRTCNAALYARYRKALRA